MPRMGVRKSPFGHAVWPFVIAGNIEIPDDHRRVKRSLPQLLKQRAESRAGLLNRAQGCHRLVGTGKLPSRVGEGGTQMHGGEFFFSTRSENHAVVVLDRRGLRTSQTVGP